MAQNDSKGTIALEHPANKTQQDLETSHPSKDKRDGDNSPSKAQAKESLRRIREAVLRHRDLTLTSLHHHISTSMLAMAFEGLNNQATPGVDRITKEEYRKELAKNLEALRLRLVNDSYRFTEVKRVYIPKADGGKRPLGICILEDKIVQGALNLILQAVYDVGFAGFSYGFRPKTRAHDALDALHEAIRNHPVNYILDADITKCFDNINHDVLFGVLKLRIKDKKILRLITRMLKAGVLEEGTIHASHLGVTQGAVISPLLANIFLSHVIDEFYVYWREEMNQGKGFSCMVRYADDFILGFQYKEQAEYFLTILKDRLLCAGLKLNKDKTRLIRFGSTAGKDDTGEKPETFKFLGFVHSCSVTWRTRCFKVLRRTISSRLNEKATMISKKLRKMILCGTDIEKVVKYINSCLNGYYNYFAVPDNLTALVRLRYLVSKSLFKWLNRRSQRRSFTWDKFNKHVQKLIAFPRVKHRYPSSRMAGRQKYLYMVRHSAMTYK